jgi:hypothetical protein
MPPNKSADRELEAIREILRALDGLDGESIQRVFDYVFNRLSIATPRFPKSSVATPVASSSGLHETHSSRLPSIRDLKEEKQPESSNQMAALVAYYLSEILAGEERRDSITTAELERFFKQAGFKLPKQLSMTLPNATAAGYFDALGNGVYRLNPVGYNLVAHGLPRAHSTAGTASKVKSRAKPKKTSKSRPISKGVKRS